MSTPTNIAQFIYFIGIGGIGMSALARYFVANGHTVAGYDRTPSAITRDLEAIGVEIVYDSAVSKIPSCYTDSQNTLVIYTPAIPSKHEQLIRFRESKYMVIKRAQALAMIANNSTCLAVAGTHGKTTTASMLGHMLAASGVSVTAFVGGQMTNYKSNLILKGNSVVVVEADEFDRSFMALNPDMACITTMDADHLDIYETAQNLEATFNDFAKAVKGDVFAQTKLQIGNKKVGIADTQAHYYAENVKLVNGAYKFDLVYNGKVLTDLSLALPGRHNLMNAVTALAMALSYGVSERKLVNALASYKGVERRFSIRFKSGTKVLIDDYAHHPTEISAVFDSVKELYPNDEVLAVFQPHLYSRTQDFLPEFVKALSRFDAVVLLPIYAAREEPLQGVTSQVICDGITHQNKKVLKKEELFDYISLATQKVVVMMGAGDIGIEILKIQKQLEYEV